MFKFLFYALSTAVTGAVGFGCGAYIANELCKDNYGHEVFKYPES